MHDIAGGGDRGEQGVVAADIRVGEPAATGLGQPVGFDDRRVHIDRDRPVARPRPAAPRPGHDLARDPVELAGMAPGERPEEHADR